MKTSKDARIVILQIDYDYFLVPEADASALSGMLLGMTPVDPTYEYNGPNYYHRDETPPIRFRVFDLPAEDIARKPPPNLTPEPEVEHKKDEAVVDEDEVPF